MYRVLGRLVVVVALLLAVACGGKNASTNGNDPKSALSAAFAKVKAQRGVHLSQNVAVDAGGFHLLKLDNDIQTEKAGGSYEKASAAGTSLELAARDGKAYERVASSDWSVLALDQLGIDAPALTTSFDPSRLALNVEARPDVTENGVRLHHFNTTLDPGSYQQALRTLFGAGGPVGSALQQTDVHAFTLDYYVRAKDGLPQRVEMQFSLSVAGVGASARGSMTYLSYNQPVAYPNDLPK